MAQRYKLRLGDGTVLAVDSEGLGTWAHDRRAMAQAIGTQQWRPLQDVMAEEAAAARLAAALVPPKPRTPPPQAPPEPSPMPPEPAAPAAPSFEAPFEPASLMSPAAPSAPAFELPDLPAAAPAAPTTSSFAPQEFDLSPTPGTHPPLAQSFADDPAPVSFRDEPAPVSFRDEPQPPSEPPRSLVEEPVSSRYFEAAAEPAPRDDEIAVIPMKPLDVDERGYREDPEEAFRSAWTDDGTVVDDEEEGSRGPLDDQTLTVLERVGGFLSRVLGPLAPAADKLTSRRQRAAAAEASYEPEEEEEEEEEEQEPEPEEPAGPSLFERIAAWASGLRERLSALVERFKPKAREESAAEEEEDVEAEEDEVEEERDEPPYSFAPSPPPRPAAQASAPPPRPVVPENVHVPPKPATQLPVVPFKQLPPEPRHREDVYGGGDSGFSLSFLEPVWQWTKFLVTTGALVGALWYAWVERAKWLPRAADLGQSMFSELDRQVLSRTRHQERQKALEAAGQKLPHLSQETIALVFARNPLGVEEPPEVFQIAREAAERGAPTLPAAEAEELRTLESELLNGLTRIERERVREYDETRARRGVFSFENPRAMELVAQGARLLPADRRARLQALLHKAVSAGLELPPPAAAPAGGSS